LGPCLGKLTRLCPLWSFFLIHVYRVQASFMRVPSSEGTGVLQIAFSCGSHDETYPPFHVRVFSFFFFPFHVVGVCGCGAFWGYPVKRVACPSVFIRRVCTPFPPRPPLFSPQPNTPFSPERCCTMAPPLGAPEIFAFLHPLSTGPSPPPAWQGWVPSFPQLGFFRDGARAFSPGLHFSQSLCTHSPQLLPLCLKSLTPPPCLPGHASSRVCSHLPVGRKPSSPCSLPFPPVRVTPPSVEANCAGHHTFGGQFFGESRLWDVGRLPAAGFLFGINRVVECTAEDCRPFPPFTP